MGQTLPWRNRPQGSPGLPHLGPADRQAFLLTTNLKKGKIMNNETKNTETQIANVFDCLAITNVQVFPFKEGPSMGHMKGLATVVFNDQLMLRGLRIMDGENGLFVGYPNDPFYKGEDFRCIAQPITRQLREHIENCILEKYQAAIA